MSGFRTDLRASDSGAVRALVAATGFFSADEIAVAVELVDEARAKGSVAGYAFVFADAPDDGALLGYACFGPIPATASSYDLYWIVVAPGHQGRGLGRKLIHEAERLAAGMGATRMYVDTSGRPQYAPTRAFYEAAGYRSAAVLEDFYAPGDAKVIYVKRLSPRP